MNKFVQEGNGTVDDYFLIVGRDFDSIEDVDIIFANMLDEFGDLDEEDVELMFEERFPLIEINEYVMSEEDVAEANRKNRIQQIKIQQEAAKARASYKELQDKYKAGEFKKEPQANQDVSDPFEDAQFVSAATSASRSIESFEFAFGDKQLITVPVKDFVENYTPPTPTEFFGRFYREDESFDTEAYVEAVTLLDNADKIIERLAKAKLAEGGSKFDQGLKNIDFYNGRANAHGAEDKRATTEKSLDAMLGF